MTPRAVWPSERLRAVNWLRGLGFLTVLGGAAIAGLLAAVITPLAAAASLVALLICVVVLGAFQRVQTGISDLAKRRYVWCMLFITISWPTYIALLMPGLPRLDPRRLLAMSTLLALVYLFVGRSSVRARVRQLPPSALVAVLLLGLMTLWRLLSVFLTVPFGPAATAFFWEFAGYTTTFLFALWVLDGAAARTALSRALYVAALVCALLALMEFVFKRNLITDALLRFSNDSEMTVAMGLTRIRDGLLRAQATFEHPLLLAEFGAVVFCLALARIVFSRLAGAPSLLAWGGLVSSLLCMGLSLSRSAVACAGLGALWLFLIWLMRSRSGRTRWAGIRVGLMLGTLVLVVFVAWTFGQTMVAGKTKEQAESSMARAHMLERGSLALESSPVTGYGIGAAGELAGVHGRARVLTLDNYLLAIALESGLPYAVIFVLTILAVTWSASVRAMSDDENAAFLAGAAAVLIAMLTMRTVLAINYNLPLVFLIAGLCYPAARIASSADRKVAV